MAHVPHLYLPDPWSEAEIPLPDATRRHLEKVLRRDPGAIVTYTDGRGTMGEGRFDGATVKRGTEELVERPAPPITIAVAPPHSSDRQRMIVEKLAELGVDRLVWLQTRYGEGRAPRPDKAAAWAAGALEQSRGAHLLDISSQQLALERLPSPLFVADAGGESIPTLTGPVTLAVGPEGGFAPGEVPDDALPVRLAERILRVETAAIAGAVVLTAARLG